MSGTLDQATVQPSLPAALFSALDLAVLDGCGIRNESDPDMPGCLYFYSEEGLGEFHGLLPAALVEADNSKLGLAINGYLKRQQIPYSCGDEFGDEIDLPGSVADWAVVFQEAIKKSRVAGDGSPLNAGRNAADEIVIMGAFTADRMSPGDFGGYVVRITERVLQREDTYSALARMRDEAPPRRTGRKKARK